MNEHSISGQVVRLVWLAHTRGPSFGHPHPHGGHTNTGGGLGGVFLREFTSAIAWHTVSGLFHILGPVAVAVGLVLAVVAWRHNRKGGDRR